MLVLLIDIIDYYYCYDIIGIISCYLLIIN